MTVWRCFLPVFWPHGGGTLRERVILPKGTKPSSPP
nr:MAG TPA: Protein of unknown function (DUF1694) [Caudoviricetes sp.]DAY37691.1 MAG TPA: Protein of unknown function (DUF1694) [Caudoviricetes sp.]